MITRPILRYHGGKFMLAKWIISHFPKHKVYVEPFGGAASVLLLKNRSYCEVYNDLDGEVVNLFNIFRNRGHELVEALKFTPYSKEEFNLSYEDTPDDFERARRTVVRSFMGFSSTSASGQKTGFRSNSNRSGTTPAHDWMNYPEALPAIIDRLRGVVIENKDAMDVCRNHDGKDTLHYLDPPYVLDTRYNGQSTQCYKFEMSDLEQEQFCHNAKELTGMVIISGYDNEIYNDHLPNWVKIKKAAFADGAKKRTEILYINPQCFQKQSQLIAEL